MKSIRVLLLLIMPFGSFSQQDSVTIQFELSIPEDVKLKKCRGYISGVVINYEDGTSFKEENSYHLLNFTIKEEAQIVLNVDASKQISSLEYAIGTDSLINVSGAYDGDLDPIHGMYWAWNSGYINFKVEGERNNESFSYHIGGYANPNPTFRKKKYEVSQSSNAYLFTIDIGKILQSELAQGLSHLMSPGVNSSKFADLLSSAIQLHE